MKKLMVLGAGYSQIPLIQAAKALGVYTVVCSTPGEWPGFQAADESAFVDISAPDAILEEAEKQKIDGIATCCLDTGVPAMGRVCEAMSLPGPGEAAAFRASDKLEMKEAFQRAGVRTARHICVRSRRELENALEVLPFPIVLKAVDLMGSRGILRCDTRREALENYGKVMEATRKDYCLAEEFIEGTLFGVEAMLHNGEFLFCLPDNTEAFVNAGGVATPVGHSVPFDFSSTLDSEVQEQVRRAVRAVGIDNCPVNCDLIYREGKVYVVEITCRAGGTCLPEIVGLYYGINYYEAIVRLALNMGAENMFRKKPGCPAVLSHTLLSDRDGVVRAIRNENGKSGDIADLSFNIEPGEYIYRYRNGRDRLGQVILTGSNLMECRRRLEEVLAKIHIEFEE